MIRNFLTISSSLPLVTLCLCLCSANSASAQLPGTEAAIAVGDRVTASGVQERTIGYAFSLDNERTVTHLGIFNFNRSGQADADRLVGIWEQDSGMLLSLETLLVGPGLILVDEFLYSTLATPVELTAGVDYVIGAQYAGDNSPGLSTVSSITPIAGLNFQSTLLVSAPSVFAIPDEDFGEPLFGPNLRFAAVPEPSSALLVAFAFSTMALRRRRLA